MCSFCYSLSDSQCFKFSSKSRTLRLAWYCWLYWPLCFHTHFFLRLSRRPRSRGESFLRVCFYHVLLPSLLQLRTALELLSVSLSKSLALKATSWVHPCCSAPLELSLKRTNIHSTQMECYGNTSSQRDIFFAPLLCCIFKTIQWAGQWRSRFLLQVMKM